ncbi:hypothetical protein SM033_00105 [Vibrio phage vB_VpaM_sm033]|nr:hypothetical protein SM033_00105 [Vibrio phage vB_VpaM_sm033]
MIIILSLYNLKDYPMKSLLTLPIRAQQIACIMEDKNETQYIFICNRKCIVQKTNSSPKKPSKFIATTSFSSINEAIAFEQKLNAKGIEYYAARY